MTWLGHTCNIAHITIGELTILMTYYGIKAGAIGNILSGLPSMAAAYDAIQSLSQLYAEIARGDRMPDRARAITATQRANAYEFIVRFPDGIDHLPGDRGGGLNSAPISGVSTDLQLAIARAWSNRLSTN